MQMETRVDFNLEHTAVQQNDEVQDTKETKKTAFDSLLYHFVVVHGVQALAWSSGNKWLER